MAEQTAGDHYRARYEPGRSVLGALFTRGMLFSRASAPGRASQETAKPESVQRHENSVKRRRAVVIESPDGTIVWAKPVDSRQQADDLIDLIHQQVFSASLADFEAWLLTQQETT